MLDPEIQVNEPEKANAQADALSRLNISAETILEENDDMPPSY